jgi:hypothetical protein
MKNGDRRKRRSRSKTLRIENYMWMNRKGKRRRR